jgi:hypothetical protein
MEIKRASAHAGGVLPMLFEAGFSRRILEFHAQFMRKLE